MIVVLFVHGTRLLLYIKKESNNHLILEIKLSPKSQSSNGKNFTALFKIVLPCFIYKLSLRRNLNLLEYVAKLFKSSKFMAQLHGKIWSDVVDCSTFLRCFPVKLEIPMCSAAVV